MSDPRWETIPVPGQAPGPFRAIACPTCGDIPRVTFPTHESTRVECKCGVVLATPRGSAVWEKP